jgi:hypothetical protein
LVLVEEKGLFKANAVDVGAERDRTLWRRSFF